MDRQTVGATPRKILVSLAIAALAFGLLTCSVAVAEGIRAGLAICGRVLIPTLFPFMVLSSFVALSKYAAILSTPLRPITTAIYKLPADLGAVVLLSLVGGYPVGAKMIAALLDQEKISKATAQRMLCFCVNSGPSFVISAVGAGIFLNRRLGVILFITQTAATLIIGAAVSLRVRREEPARRQAVDMPPAEAFVAAVTNASSAMLVMCAFAVLFSGLLALLGDLDVAARLAAIFPGEISAKVVNAILSGFFEVTAGCVASARVGGNAAVLLTSVCVSFCGLSVLFQVMSCLEGRGLRFRPFVLARLAHAILAGMMAMPLYKWFCKDLPVWLPDHQPLVQVDNKTALISACLLAMCSILVLSAGESKE